VHFVGLFFVFVSGMNYDVNFSSNPSIQVMKQIGNTP